MDTFLPIDVDLDALPVWPPKFDEPEGRIVTPKRTGGFGTYGDYQSIAEKSDVIGRMRAARVIPGSWERSRDFTPTSFQQHVADADLNLYVRYGDGNSDTFELKRTKTDARDAMMKIHFEPVTLPMAFAIKVVDYIEVRQFDGPVLCSLGVNRQLMSGDILKIVPVLTVGQSSVYLGDAP